MRIGIFGGSFNPIHNGHVNLGRAMLRNAQLDEVWYMVSPQNPLKAQSTELAPEDVRLRLTQAALEREPQLKACDYEFHLPRPSYTWNTLQHLRHDYPDNDFVLIIGGDNWERFDRWAHHEEILREYEIAVYPRSGEEVRKPPKDAKKVIMYNLPLFPVSSTEVRQMIRKGDDLSKIVPDAVVTEMEKYSFYR